MVVAAILIVPRVFGSDDPTAASPSSATTVTTTTLSEETTTSLATTTTEEATTTEATTTTTVMATPTTNANGNLIEDRFEGASTAVPVFDESFMLFEEVSAAGGRGQITATGAGGVLPVLYPVPVGDIFLEFQFRAMPTNPDAGIAALMLLADDPAGGLDHYVLVWLDPQGRNVQVAKFIDGGWGETITAPMPAGAGYVDGGFNTMSVTFFWPSVSVSINGVLVVDWFDPEFSVMSGFVGPALLATGAGDRLRIDDFVVRPFGT